MAAGFHTLLRKKTTRIGLDIRSLEALNQSGVNNYISQLAHKLPKHSPEVRFYLVTNRLRSRSRALPETGNARLIRIPTASDRVYRAALRVLAVILRLDLVHVTGGYLPKRSTARLVTTVHDLTFERYPSYYVPEELAKQHLFTSLCMERADGVLAVSNATKRDIEEFFPSFEAFRIYVTALDIRASLPEPSELKRDVPPYILCVSNIQPRKNFLGAIQAFAKLKDQTINLIIAGNAQDKAEHQRVLELIDALKLQGRITLTGFVDDQELSNLYANATLFLYPSFYEGFGLPIVEAFRNNTPVITSNTSCMPEVGGDAARYCDPNSVDSMTTCIDQLLADSDLRARMIVAGQKQLAALQSVPVVASTMQAYTSIIEAAKR